MNLHYLKIHTVDSTFGTIFGQVTIHKRQQKTVRVVRAD